MGLFTKTELRKIALDRVQPLRKNAGTVLNEDGVLASARQSFDVFLSHSIQDAEVILGVKIVIEKLGFSVYVDWIEDSQLDREKVSAETAERLQLRMKQCNSLIYAHSLSSPQSKWMPWELGFFDGCRGRVAILPIAETEGQSFVGQEYLGLYPYVDQVSQGVLWVHKGNALRRRLGAMANSWDFRPLKEWMRM